MYKRGIYTVASNEKLARDVYKMVLEGNTEYITAPGQFINIELEGKYLRRPISVCDYDNATITVIYKVVGQGTSQMRAMEKGTKLDVLTGLGNGFDTSVDCQKPLLIGGGVGVPPLYHLAKKLIALGKTPTVVLGFGKAEEVFFEQEFKNLGCRVFVTTIDGSHGIQGLVTDAINNENIDYDYFFTCGPMPMLKALAQSCHSSGQLSFEEKMGCGFGGCMGCSCETKYGYKRICKEGPVLTKEEIIW